MNFFRQQARNVVPHLYHVQYGSDDNARSSKHALVAYHLDVRTGKALYGVVLLL